MTVKTLKAIIRLLPEDAEVLVQKTDAPMTGYVSATKLRAVPYRDIDMCNFLAKSVGKNVGAFQNGCLVIGTHEKE